MLAHILDTAKKRIAARSPGSPCSAGAASPCSPRAATRTRRRRHHDHDHGLRRPPRPRPSTGRAAHRGIPENSGDRPAPALVVKIDNDDPEARPQVGLDEADVVYEEMVEGSITRFLAVFHSTDSDPVGPVRSARSTDQHRSWASSAARYFAGGAAATTSRACTAPCRRRLRRQRGDYYRERAARRRTTCCSSTAACAARRTTARAAAGRCSPTAPRGPAPIRRAGGRASAARRGFGARVDHRVALGQRRTGPGSRTAPPRRRRAASDRPANVVIQFVDYVDTTVDDQSGARPRGPDRGRGRRGSSPTAAAVVVKGRAKPNDARGQHQLHDADGNPIQLTPGRTWVELPRPAAATHRCERTAPRGPEGAAGTIGPWPTPPRPIATTPAPSA